MYKWRLGKESCWMDADVDTESIEGVGNFTASYLFRLSDEWQRDCIFQERYWKFEIVEEEYAISKHSETELPW